MLAPTSSLLGLDMDSNLLIRNFPGGMGGWRIYFRWKPRQPLGLRLKLCQSERCTGWLTVAWRTNIIWLLVFINYLTNGKGIRSLATFCAIWRPIHFRWRSYFLCERSRYWAFAAFWENFWKGSKGTKKGQKFDFTHQTCRLIALDDISVVRPKNFLPTARKMRGGTMCPPQV